MSTNDFTLVKTSLWDLAERIEVYMIDLQFERYMELKLSNFKLVDTYPVQHWTHCIVRFEADRMPSDICDPEALVILNKDKDVLQIVLQEEGCDSPNYQFTELEKQTITDWITTQPMEA